MFTWRRRGRRKRRNIPAFSRRTSTVVFNRARCSIGFCLKRMLSFLFHMTAGDISTAVGLWKQQSLRLVAAVGHDACSCRHFVFYIPVSKKNDVTWPDKLGSNLFLTLPSRSKGTGNILVHVLLHASNNTKSSNQTPPFYCKSVYNDFLKSVNYCTP